MDVGIGIPNAIRGVSREGILEWARRAEAAGFSSLGTIDRLVYPSYEPLISLAAAAAVTERIGLVTNILIAPLHANTALLAKQAATIDSLSCGRLKLGLGVGGRAEDFEVGGVDFHARGRTFDGQLEDLTRVWRGGTLVGPRPANGNRPGLLIGGQADVAFRRAARYADGWTMAGGSPASLAVAREKLSVAWRDAGRDARPWIMALFYFALGDNADDTARKTLGHYYAFRSGLVERFVASAATDAATVRRYLDDLDVAGADEVICFPTSASVAQVDRLADAALR